MPRKFSLFIFILLTYNCFASSVHAREYNTNFNASYTLQNNGNADVVIHVDITHSSTNTYVSQFSVGFPSSFKLENVHARDNFGDAIVNAEDKDGITKLTVILNNPEVGKGSKNSFDLMFMQKNLFASNSNAWEVVLPVIRDDVSSGYTVSIKLPKGNGKKISIAKPLPTSITDQEIVWNNPKSKTIYALFGNNQYYRLDLTYHLKNNRLSPGYYDVALPPDTAYQKIYVESINPQPDLTYLDSDGNYMARFTVSPHKEIAVNFKGFANVFIAPQEDYRQYAKQITDDKKKELLVPKKYWSLTDISKNDEIRGFKTPQDIYNFVIKKLTYNYSRVNKQVTRIGATALFTDPNNAICMEFTDLFVTLSRHIGIPTRENQGFGFTTDASLRPVSLLSDVLHSWPEYYDDKKNVWIQIDPTWGKTSGIDYFSSFDLNHITFAIHGTDSVYPLPAGTYKIKDSKDVSVDVANSIPKANVIVDVSENTNDKLYTGHKYNGAIELTNTGNVFIKSADLTVKSDHIRFSPSTISIAALAPLEKKTFNFTYQAKDVVKTQNDTISYYLNGAEIQSKSITIVPLHTVFTQLKLIGSISLFITVLVLVIFTKKRRK